METELMVKARERLLRGLPVTERRLELAGVSTAVLEGGSGRPLVLLHGPGEHALKWLRVLPALVARHRVIAPDLPGHGSSVVGDGVLDAERVLGWLEALLDATCPAPPVVVGQIVGGAIAARFAAGRRRPLTRLILSDTLGLVPFQPDPAFGEAVLAFLAGPDEVTFARLWRRCAFDADRLQSEMGERWDAYAEYSLERVRSPEGRAAMQRLMEEFGFPAIPAAELARIEVPTALIWGRHDLATPLGVAEEAGRRLGWPLHVVEESGDDPAMEQPEHFIEALQAATAVTPAA